MIRSLLYVSRATFPSSVAEATVREIVGAARVLNANESVTGALVYTQGRFAQNLEGPAATLDGMMARIVCDPRHASVTIVYDELLPARRFPDWTMAYAGPSTFVAGNILPLTDPAEPPVLRKAAERLIELMRQFAAAHRIAAERNGENSQIRRQ